MGTIGLVAPDEYSFEEARAVVKKQAGGIILALGVQEKGVAEAARLVQQGVEVIISRGETAKAIMAAFPEVTVVAIKRSGFDISRALGRALEHGGPIAVVAFPYILERIATICNALHISVTIYPLESRTDSEKVILRAVSEGAKVIVGAVTGAVTAQRLGIPYEVVQSGVESLTEAVDEARAIMQARQLDKAKMSLLHTVLDATDEGIVAVDADGAITLLNAVAERYTGHEAKDAVGRPLGTVWPELSQAQAVKKGEADPHLLVKVKDTTFVCNIAPVKVDSVVSGAVCTFHDAGRVQAMEAAVRRRLHAAGLVAGMRFQDMQGRGPALKQAIATAKQYARSEDTVLLSGETGTGKELFAQSIHNHSARCRGPFVAVNCAALPGHLLESELFGYVAGAFTGASSKGKTGLFELAHGGTIFLDEITEMEPGIQAKLLRVLQEKKVMRLGGDQVIAIDVRIIASTNKDLKKLADGTDFRRDLYYRLNVLLLHLPPLRDRQEDIPGLCRFFLKSRTPQAEALPVFTHDAYAVLKAYPWPGNIRELQNVMARIIATAKGKTVDGKTVRAMLDDGGAKEKRTFARDQAEQILEALREAKGRRGLAAQRLGMSRATLWRKMRDLGL